MQTLRLLRAQGERGYQIYMGVVILACGDPALDRGLLTAGSPLREDDDSLLKSVPFRVKPVWKRPPS